MLLPSSSSRLPPKGAPTVEDASVVHQDAMASGTNSRLREALRDIQSAVTTNAVRGISSFISLCTCGRNAGSQPIKCPVYQYLETSPKCSELLVCWARVDPILSRHLQKSGYVPVSITGFDFSNNDAANSSAKATVLAAVFSALEAVLLHGAIAYEKKPGSCAAAKGASNMVEQLVTGVLAAGFRAAYILRVPDHDVRSKLHLSVARLLATLPRFRHLCHKITRGIDLTSPLILKGFLAPPAGFHVSKVRLAIDRGEIYCSDSDIVRQGHKQAIRQSLIQMFILLIESTTHGGTDVSKETSACRAPSTMSFSLEGRANSCTGAAAAYVTSAAAEWGEDVEANQLEVLQCFFSENGILRDGSFVANLLADPPDLCAAFLKAFKCALLESANVSTAFKATVCSGRVFQSLLLLRSAYASVLEFAPANGQNELATVTGLLDEIFDVLIGENGLLHEAADFQSTVLHALRSVNGLHLRTMQETVRLILKCVCHHSSFGTRAVGIAAFDTAGLFSRCCSEVAHRLREVADVSHFSFEQSSSFVWCRGVHMTSLMLSEAENVTGVLPSATPQISPNADESRWSALSRSTMALPNVWLNILDKLSPQDAALGQLLDVITVGNNPFLSKTALSTALSHTAPHVTYAAIVLLTQVLNLLQRFQSNATESFWAEAKARVATVLLPDVSVIFNLISKLGRKMEGQHISCVSVPLTEHCSSFNPVYIMNEEDSMSIQKKTIPFTVRGATGINNEDGLLPSDNDEGGSAAAQGAAGSGDGCDVEAEEALLPQKKPEAPQRSTSALSDDDTDLDITFNLDLNISEIDVTKAVSDGSGYGFIEEEDQNLLARDTISDSQALELLFQAAEIVSVLREQHVTSYLGAVAWKERKFTAADILNELVPSRATTSSLLQALAELIQLYATVFSPSVFESLPWWSILPKTMPLDVLSIGDADCRKEAIKNINCPEEAQDLYSAVVGQLLPSLEIAALVLNIHPATRASYSPVSFKLNRDGRHIARWVNIVVSSWRHISVVRQQLIRRKRLSKDLSKCILKLRSLIASFCVRSKLFVSSQDSSHKEGILWTMWLDQCVKSAPGNATAENVLQLFVMLTRNVLCNPDAFVRAMIQENVVRNGDGEPPQPFFQTSIMLAALIFHWRKHAPLGLAARHLYRGGAALQPVVRITNNNSSSNEPNTFEANPSFVFPVSSCENTSPVVKRRRLTVSLGAEDCKALVDNIANQEDTAAHPTADSTADTAANGTPANTTAADNAAADNAAADNAPADNAAADAAAAAAATVGIAVATEVFDFFSLLLNELPAAHGAYQLITKHSWRNLLELPSHSENKNSEVQESLARSRRTINALRKGFVFSGGVPVDWASDDVLRIYCCSDAVERDEMPLTVKDNELDNALKGGQSLDVVEATICPVGLAVSNHADMVTKNISYSRDHGCYRSELLSPEKSEVDLEILLRDFSFVARGLASISKDTPRMPSIDAVSKIIYNMNSQCYVDSLPDLETAILSVTGYIQRVIEVLTSSDNDAFNEDKRISYLQSFKYPVMAALWRTLMAVWDSEKNSTTSGTTNLSNRVKKAIFLVTRTLLQGFANTVARQTEANCLEYQLWNFFSGFALVVMSWEVFAKWDYDLKSDGTKKRSWNRKKNTSNKEFSMASLIETTVNSRFIYDVFVHQNNASLYVLCFLAVLRRFTEQDSQEVKFSDDTICPEESTDSADALGVASGAVPESVLRSDLCTLDQFLPLNLASELARRWRASLSMEDRLIKYLLFNPEIPLTKFSEEWTGDLFEFNDCVGAPISFDKNSWLSFTLCRVRATLDNGIFPSRSPQSSNKMSSPSPERPAATAAAVAALPSYSMYEETVPVNSVSLANFVSMGPGVLQIVEVLTEEGAVTPVPDLYPAPLGQDEHRVNEQHGKQQKAWGKTASSGDSMKYAIYDVSYVVPYLLGRLRAAWFILDDLTRKKRKMPRLPVAKILCYGPNLDLKDSANPADSAEQFYDENFYDPASGRYGEGTEFDADLVVKSGYMDWAVRAKEFMEVSDLDDAGLWLQKLVTGGALALLFRGLASNAVGTRHLAAEALGVVHSLFTRQRSLALHKAKLKFAADLRNSIRREFRSRKASCDGASVQAEAWKRAGTALASGSLQIELPWKGFDEILWLLTLLRNSLVLEPIPEEELLERGVQTLFTVKHNDETKSPAVSPLSNLTAWGLPSQNSDLQEGSTKSENANTLLRLAPLSLNVVACCITILPLLLNPGHVLYVRLVGYLTSRPSLPNFPLLPNLMLWGGRSIVMAVPARILAGHILNRSIPCTGSTVIHQAYRQFVQKGILSVALMSYKSSDDTDVGLSAGTTNNVFTEFLVKLVKEFIPRKGTTAAGAEMLNSESIAHIVAVCRGPLLHWLQSEIWTLKLWKRQIPRRNPFTGKRAQCVIEVRLSQIGLVLNHLKQFLRHMLERLSPSDVTADSTTLTGGQPAHSDTNRHCNKNNDGGSADGETPPYKSPLIIPPISDLLLRRIALLEDQLC